GAENGVVIVDVDKPLAPRVVATIPELKAATGIAVQFRYAFVTTHDGLSSVDITDPNHPRVAGRVAIPDARSVYAARTYAYVGGGAHGMVIVDVEQPDMPAILQ